MPVLIPNETIFSRNVENTTKNGSYIDEILSDSIYYNLKNTFSKKINNKMAKINKKVRIPLKESCISSPITTNALKNRSQPQKKEQKKRRYRIAYRRHTKKDLEAKNMETKNLIKEGSLDDSLTSLQWLTGVRVNDLMEGRSIHTPPPSPAPSSSSDCNDVDNHWVTSINSENVFDYREIKEVKPPYSYAVLIIMAMKSKPSGKMTLSEIYKWIAENFLFFRNAEPTWQNSIRHNLSLNKCFAKIPRQKGDTGKGGYWTVVAEFANRVLENSIRKRRSNVYSTSEHSTIRRQRLDLFENQLLINIKAEKELEHDNVRQELPKTLLEDITLTPLKDSLTDEVNSLEYYQLDHSYGKSPVVNYNVSDVENIRAIATHLEGTASNFNVCNEDNALVTSDRNISSTLRTDCIWSTESMSKSTEELLEARRMDSSEHTLLRNIDNSLNTSNGFDSLFYCLSPPLSGDDESYCDDLEDLGSDNTVLCDNDLEYLTVRGTRMKLFDPKTEVNDSLKYDIKSEPLSPISMDLNE